MAEDRPVTTERFEDYCLAHKREHELIQSAQDAAKRMADIRLDGLNHLRREVERDRSLFVTNVEATLINKALDERLRKVETQLAAQSSSTTTWVIAIGIIFVVVQIALRLFLNGGVQ